jgi:hypothetical protein
MSVFTRFLKRFGSDIAGWSCILASGLIGWLPGPGGVPLLLLGLSLLARHNAWARRLLELFQQHSSSLRSVIFPAKPFYEWGWDIVSILLFVGSFMVVTGKTHSPWVRLASSLLMSLGLALLLLNRRRLERLLRKR